MIDIDDVMGVLARSRGIRKDDEGVMIRIVIRVYDNASKLNKMDIELDGDNEIELSRLRGDVDSSYDAAVHNRAPGQPYTNLHHYHLTMRMSLTINLDIV